MRTFPPSEIKIWIDKDFSGVGQTALCPFCPVDSVLGSESGYPIVPEFLKAMRDYWFGTDPKY